MGTNAPAGRLRNIPTRSFESFTDSFKYLQENPNNVACSTLDPNLQASSVVGDTSNSFCIDPAHIAPITQFYTDMTNNALPSFVWIDPGYGLNDEHPGSGQPVTQGQYEVTEHSQCLHGEPCVCRFGLLPGLRRRRRSLRPRTAGARALQRLHQRCQYGLSRRLSEWNNPRYRHHCGESRHRIRLIGRACRRTSRRGPHLCIATCKRAGRAL